MSTEFYVGQQVVCVNDTNGAFYHPSMAYQPVGTLNGLKRGCIYKVRGLGAHEFTKAPGLYLEEIIRPIMGDESREATFNCHRFRPVAKQDISIFTAMLQPSPKTEKADAA